MVVTCRTFSVDTVYGAIMHVMLEGNLILWPTFDYVVLAQSHFGSCNTDCKRSTCFTIAMCVQKDKSCK